MTMALEGPVNKRAAETAATPARGRGRRELRHRKPEGTVITVLSLGKASTARRGLPWTAFSGNTRLTLILMPKCLPMKVRDVQLPQVGKVRVGAVRSAAGFARIVGITSGEDGVAARPCKVCKDSRTFGQHLAILDFIWSHWRTAATPLNHGRLLGSVIWLFEPLNNLWARISRRRRLKKRWLRIASDKIGKMRKPLAIGDD